MRLVYLLVLLMLVVPVLGHGDESMPDEDDPLSKYYAGGLMFFFAELALLVAILLGLLFIEWKYSKEKKEAPFYIKYVIIVVIAIIVLLFYYYPDAASHDVHGVIEVDEPVSLEVNVFEDSMGGYNIQIITDLRFAPGNVGSAHVPGEGHAHLYVDGVKYARVYGEWFHLPVEAEEILVTLNANNHDDISYNGVKVEERVVMG